MNITFSIKWSYQISIQESIVPPQIVLVSVQAFYPCKIRSIVDLLEKGESFEVASLLRRWKK